MSAEAAFMGDGFDPFPNSFLDNQHVAEFSEWSDETITRKTQEYYVFLTREDIQPRARSATERILAHLNFETDYRAGYYDHAPNDLSELGESHV